MAAVFSSMILFFNTAAFSHTEGPQAKAVFEFTDENNVLKDISLSAKHAFKLGLEVSHIRYKEPVMKETGLMYGLVGSYTYHHTLMLKVEGKYSWGDVDYEGMLHRGAQSIPYNIRNVKDYMWEVRSLAGYDFSFGKAITVTPYLGIGYRYLNDDLSSDRAGYERESNYLYSPIGVLFAFKLENGWSLEAMGEYDYFWRGTQKSHLENLLKGLNTLENKQNGGYGLRGSMTLQKKYTSAALEAGPFVKYWNIDKSERGRRTFYGYPIGYGHEPANNSTEIGVMLGVKF